MKKRLLFIHILLLASIATMAQNFGGLGNQFSGMGRNNGTNENDTAKKEVESIPPKLYMWNLDEKLGSVQKIPVDTINYNFQNSNQTGGMSGHYNYLGNLGAPRMSRIFFERTKSEPNSFLEPFSFFLVQPGQFKFTNSNIPYTNLTYYKGGSKEYGEERFKAYFSVNVNKHLAFGFNFDYLYGRGFYNNQSTSFFNGSLFLSYFASHYDASAIYSNNYMKMNENGGITDDRYITDPEAMSSGGKNYETQNMPTNLNSSSNRNRNNYFFFTQRYKLGFKRQIKVVLKDSISTPNDSNSLKGKVATPKAQLKKAPLDKKPDVKRPDIKKPEPPKANDPNKKPEGVKPEEPLEKKELASKSKDLEVKKDSFITEFVPVTSFIHTLKIDRTFRHFHSGDNTTYTNTYIKPSTTLINDTTQYIGIKNTFGIALLEGFNKYAKAGLTAYISHKLSQYKLMDADSTSIDKINEHEVYVGGELSKRQGNTLHYMVNGEFGILEKAIGQFNVNGNIDLNFHLMKDTVHLIARANFSNLLPDFYLRHYHSKHYYWDDDMKKEFRSRLEGELSIDRLQTRLQFGIENIKNYTYFDSNALPAQYTDNIQVLSATISQNFRLGALHLDNEVTWQKSSKDDILPLPSLSLYHNLYLQTKLAHKVLNVQLGADVRYFTKYYAPTYTPDIQQFNLQKTSNRIELGAYPLISVYANLQLKRTRFYAMFYHVNAGSGNNMYFLVPHYPLNQRLFKLGISWNFYD